MKQIKQVMPNYLVVRALKQYQIHLADLKTQIGSDKFYNLNATLSEDEFDLHSEILLYSSSKIELSFDKDLKDNFHKLNAGGVDYPEFTKDYPLYEVETKVVEVTETKLTRL